MVGDVVDTAKRNMGSAFEAGSEDTAAYLLSLALSPMGLALIAGVVLVTLWKARG